MNNSKTYDIVGMGLSVICGIHCIVTPFLIVSAPAIGEGLESIWAHTFLIVLMIFSFYQSVFKHYKMHLSKLTLGLGFTGIIFILITYINEIFAHSHEEHHEAGHIEVHDQGMMLYVGILGALFLVSSHFMNIKKCKCLIDLGSCDD